LLISLSAVKMQAQSISGYVFNENNEPIPHVSIFLKNQNMGTTTDLQGKYFLRLTPGDYELVFTSLGYQLYEVSVVVGDQPVQKNVWLKSSSTELEQIVIKASKRDPAYEIIQKVIDNRAVARVNSMKSDVYIKAFEILDKKQKENKPTEVKATDETGQTKDPFEEERLAELAKLNSTNMVEMNASLNYQFPNKYKEDRTGYKLYGSAAGLFIPRFSESDFNIYENLVHLKGVAELPVVSPISRTSIVSYRYQLAEVLKERGRPVYKIRVIPRNKGNSTVSGYVFVNDSLWNINRLDLEFGKGALKFYDAFQLRQSYQPIGPDSAWVTYRQEFTYETRQGKLKTFKGNTVIHYSGQEPGYSFPEKFFDNEVVSITKEAYERDSSYWNSTRPEPLTIDEQEVVHFRDSVFAVVNSKKYKDSIEAKFNKVTVMDILYQGVAFRSHEKQRNVNFSGLTDIINFSVIGGFRLGPSGSYFRRFDTGHLLWTVSSFTVGIKNKDFQWHQTAFYRYLPFQLGDIQVRGGREFQSVNSIDAYLNQLKISNYILHDFVSVFHRIELFNGFYAKIEASYSERKSLERYDRTSILNTIIDETDPLLFENYEAFITDASLSYTPQQKYMREPTYKRVLGSNYPTVTLTHKRGWQGPLSSDVDFDYGELMVNQDLILGIFGTSRYSIKTGKFINTNELKYVDLKRFRQSDPYLYSDPRSSFQLLDTSLVARNWYVEAHHVHHFNGAIINNVPFVKKLGLSIVGGAGILWVKESNFRHEEVFGGVERIFKLGPRRRLRIGFIGVLAESNRTQITSDWKVSFEIMDTWSKTWSY
jgi:hypothetical protein